MRIRALLGAVVVVTSVFVFGSAAEAATACPPNPAAGSTVSGNLNVPSGGVCTLQDVTVTGNVTVSSGGELLMFGGRIGGNLSVTDGFVFTDQGRTGVPSIGGSVNLSAPRNWFICNIAVSGSFSEHDETVVSAPPVGFPGCGPVLFGPVGGNLSFQNNHVHFSWSQTQVGGNFVATGNTAGADFTNLVINGSATCSNTPPATFTSSTVAGTNTCPG